MIVNASPDMPPDIAVRVIGGDAVLLAFVIRADEVGAVTVDLQGQNRMSQEEEQAIEFGFLGILVFIRHVA